MFGHHKRMEEEWWPQWIFQWTPVENRRCGRLGKSRYENIMEIIEAKGLPGLGAVATSGEAVRAANSLILLLLKTDRLWEGYQSQTMIYYLFLLRKFIRDSSEASVGKKLFCIQISIVIFLYIIWNLQEVLFFNGKLRFSLSSLVSQLSASILYSSII